LLTWKVADRLARFPPASPGSPRLSWGLFFQ
jgi:hypothetical protein